VSQGRLRILSPEDGFISHAAEVSLRVAVKTGPGEELKRIVALLAGREIAQIRGIQLASHAPPSSAVLEPGESAYDLSLTLPPSDAVVEVHAETTTGQVLPAQVRVRWAGSQEPEFVVPPRLYVLAIGIANYERPELRLAMAAKDARDIAAVLSRQQGRLYREVVSRIVVDQAASKAAILDGLEWIQRQTTVRDVAVVFVAGHGINDVSTGHYHFLPYDADLSAIKRTTLSQQELQSSLRSIPGKVLFLLDSCHSGNLLGAWAARGVADLSVFISELVRSEGGVVVFAASTGGQSAQESPAWGNGVFTKAVLEGLRGAAAFIKGRPITVNMLDLYISERVKDLTGGVQTPTTAKPSSLPDFPVAVPLPPEQSAAAVMPPSPPVLNAPSLAAADTLERPVSSSRLGATSSPRRSRPPPYKRWWVWALVGTLAATGIVTGAVLGHQASGRGELVPLSWQN
jgi:hypothetical protein